MSPRVVLPPPAAPPAYAGAGLSRRAAAHALWGASRALDRVAQRLASPPAAVLRAVRNEAVPHVEFHADAGAPEGALYVDGCFVGWLPGVNRL